MNVREYLSVRRAFGLVRQGMPAEERITFEELGIVCHLGNLGRPLRTSEIAEYQGVLRPTMTHRSGHLSAIGLISREAGEADRRSVCCALTDEGERRMEAVLAQMCASIKPSMPLSRCTPARMGLIVDEFGRASFSSADLVLLGLYACESKTGSSVGTLVAALGLLQPTVSMAVSALTKQGLVGRVQEGAEVGRAALVALTPAGERRAEELVERIEAFHVRRTRG